MIQTTPEYVREILTKHIRPSWGGCMCGWSAFDRTWQDHIIDLLDPVSAVEIMLQVDAHLNRKQR